jgi:aldose 1-epimerase
VKEVVYSDGTVDVVVLPEAGARLHRLRAFGHDVLRTPDDPAEHLRDPFSWGAYVMAPWCNRVGSDPIPVGTRRVDLGSNFPDGTAIHGQVYVRPWEVRSDRSLVVHGGGDGWPWTYEVSLRVTVVERSVRLELGLRNRSAEPMPAGLGIHPWFRTPLLVAIRGDAVYPSNTATEPRPEPEPVRGPLDLRTLGVMSPGLDATWAGLAEPPVELLWPDAAIRATMRISAPTRYVVAASSSDLGAVAVEPETHAPQGLRRMLDGLPGGLAVLGPGRRLALAVELAFERSDQSPRTPIR